MTQNNSDDLCIFVPDCNIVASSIPVIKEHISGYLEKNAHTLMIDMQNVKSIDSIGIGLLVATHNTLKKNGSGLALRNISPEIMNLFTVMRLDRHFII